MDVGLVGMKIESQCIFESPAVDELVIVAPNTDHFRRRYCPKHALMELLKEPIVMRTGRTRKAAGFPFGRICQDKRAISCIS